MRFAGCDVTHVATCYPWNSPTGTCVSVCTYELTVSCARAGAQAVSRICNVFMRRQSLLPAKVVVSGRTGRVTGDVFLCCQSGTTAQ